VVFKSVNELGVVPLDPPNNGLLRKEKQQFSIIIFMLFYSYLAPSEASDAANGVDDELKPVVVVVDEIFESVFVK